MVYIDGIKYACERCIRGHRVSACQHTDKPLTMIKPKGRPTTQCAHCREHRRSRALHTKCLCGAKSPKSHEPMCPCASDAELCTCANKKKRASSNPPAVGQSPSPSRSSSTTSLASRRSITTGPRRPRSRAATLDSDHHHTPSTLISSPHSPSVPSSGQLFQGMAPLYPNLASHWHSSSSGPGTGSGSGGSGSGPASTMSMPISVPSVPASVESSAPASIAGSVHSTTSIPSSVTTTMSMTNIVPVKTLVPMTSSVPSTHVQPPLTDDGLSTTSSSIFSYTVGDFDVGPAVAPTTGGFSGFDPIAETDGLWEPPSEKGFDPNFQGVSAFDVGTDGGQQRGPDLFDGLMFDVSGPFADLLNTPPMPGTTNVSTSTSDDYISATMWAGVSGHS
uniref:ARAD1C34672p n=1 Tax=Blastobotrys adeninivorans TaxID=409370 RepID=A0A060T3L4_BLAAD